MTGRVKMIQLQQVKVYNDKSKHFEQSDPIKSFILLIKKIKVSHP